MIEVFSFLLFACTIFSFIVVIIIVLLSLYSDDVVKVIKAIRGE